MSATRIDGNGVASKILATLARKVDHLKSHSDVSPGLAIVVASSDPVQRMWANLKIRSAARVGISAELTALSGDVTQQSLIARINELNVDDRYHGIFVQLPLPDEISESDVRYSIAPHKDVDCMHPVNVTKLVDGLGDGFSPASVLAVHEALRSVPIDLSEKHILICGRSQDAALMAAYFFREAGGKAAKVTLSDPESLDILSQVSSADIVIAAIGEPLFIDADMINPNAVVIDTGQNLIADTNRKSGYRVVGDVDFDGVSNKARAVTPVPGGLGPITVAMLLANTVEAARSTVG